MPAESGFITGRETFFLLAFRGISSSGKMNYRGPTVRVVKTGNLPIGIVSLALAGKGHVTTVLTTQPGATLEERAQMSATLESNPPRNSQSETHPDDERGLGAQGSSPHRTDRFPHASENSWAHLL